MAKKLSLIEEIVKTKQRILTQTLRFLNFYQEFIIQTKLNSQKITYILDKDGKNDVKIISFPQQISVFNTVLLFSLLF